MPKEGRLIPDSINANVRVQVVLPDEATQLLRDLHQDRQTIGAGSLIALACTVAMAWKAVFGREK